HVHVLDAFVDHADAPSGNVIDHASDGFFVPRNVPGGDHDRIVRPDLHVPVIVDGDAGECGHRFALGPRREAEDILRGIPTDLGVPDLHARRYTQVTAPLGDLEDFAHPQPNDANLASRWHRQLND